MNLTRNGEAEMEVQGWNEHAEQNPENSKKNLFFCLENTLVLVILCKQWHFPAKVPPNVAPSLLLHGTSLPRKESMCRFHTLSWSLWGSRETRSELRPYTSVCKLRMHPNVACMAELQRITRLQVASTSSCWIVAAPNAPHFRRENWLPHSILYLFLTSWNHLLGWLATSQMSPNPHGEFYAVSWGKVDHFHVSGLNYKISWALRPQIWIPYSLLLQRRLCLNPFIFHAKLSMFSFLSQIQPSQISLLMQRLHQGDGGGSKTGEDAFELHKNLLQWAWILFSSIMFEYCSEVIESDETFSGESLSTSVLKHADSTIGTCWLLSSCNIIPELVPLISGLNWGIWLPSTMLWSMQGL